MRPREQPLPRPSSQTTTTSSVKPRSHLRRGLSPTTPQRAFSVYHRDMLRRQRLGPSDDLNSRLPPFRRIPPHRSSSDSCTASRRETVTTIRTRVSSRLSAKSSNLARSALASTRRRPRRRATANSAVNLAPTPALRGPHGSAANGDDQREKTASPKRSAASSGGDYHERTAAPNRDGAAASPARRSRALAAFALATDSRPGPFQP